MLAMRASGMTPPSSGRGKKCSFLIEKINSAGSDRIQQLIAQSRLLSDSAFRAESLKEWLSGAGQAGQYNRLTDSADIQSIAESPPLPFFALFEAATDSRQQGMTLGVLGSILVAEVVFGALAKDQLPAEIGATSLKQALGNLSASIYEGTDHFGSLEEIESMPQLIEVTAKLAHLKDAVPAFL